MIEDTEDLEPVEVPPVAPGTWWSGAQPPPSAPTGDGPSEWRPPAALLLVIAMVAAGLLGFAVTNKLVSGDDFQNLSGSASPTPNFPTPTTPGLGGGLPTPSTVPGNAVSRDPDASVVTKLVVQQRDVTSGFSVALIPDGDLAVGTTTLDLCNGTYPSESLRTTRFQVIESDGISSTLSTEAVLYKNPAAAAQGMRELQSVKNNCPNAPVVSPVGEPTVTTTFGTAPDATWAKVAGVERQAYDFHTDDGTANLNHSVAVYLRRGRALMGVYFSSPDGVQPAVDGQTTVAGITNVFAKRMAALPASVVNRGG